MIALNNRAAPTQPGTALIVFIDYLVSIIRTLISILSVIVRSNILLASIMFVLISMLFRYYINWFTFEECLNIITNDAYQALTCFKAFPAHMWCDNNIIQCI